MSLKTKIKKISWLCKHKKQWKRIIQLQRAAFRNELSKIQGEYNQIDIIRQSEMFDKEWYLKNRPDVDRKGVDPAKHYFYSGFKGANDPSPWFSNEEYLSLNLDVAKAGINPIVHYELSGKNEGRPISYLEEKEVVFPDKTEELSREFEITTPKTKRTAVLSCFFSDGLIHDDLLFLIHGLKEVVDNIILIGDCKINPNQLDRLQGLICYAEFERHEQYDFGSYKRGLEYAREKGLLDECYTEELILINDSCYGPVFPFEESLKKMAEKPCDFWGYTEYRSNAWNRHISSYFILFKRDIIYSKSIECFLEHVTGKYDRGKVIFTLETKLTEYLENKGFSWALYIEDGLNAFQCPVSLLKLHRIPLVKKKAFTRKSNEDLQEALRIIEHNAPELAQCIQVKLPYTEHHFITLEEHQSSFNSKCELIRSKVKNGEKIKALFLVSDSSMFPGRPLFELMLKDPQFDAYYVVVPDKRKENNGSTYYLRKTEKAMQTLYPRDRQIIVRPDELLRWPDVCEDADIVCYSIPYAFSSFRYNPRYAVGRKFLPIMVNYGYYRSIYDRQVLARADTYPYMWKAFFECEDNMNEYRACSPIHGANADLTGYIKMDALAKKKKAFSARKRILIALHHSVEGGMNDALALANIIRYKDYFKNLPQKYPEIDFVFRPHSFLKIVLSEPQFWGEEETIRYFEEIKSNKNVIWDETPDYFESFCQSDGCIQDCGSFLVEYLYTGNPCCYMLKDPNDIMQKFSPLGQKCLENCYLSFNTGDIDRFIENVIIGENDEKKLKREEFSKGVMLNYPHAADVALRHIKEGIFGSAKDDEV